MSEKGKGKDFIIYANSSLREDPKNLLKIYDALIRSDADPAVQRKVVEAVVECMLSDDSDNLNFEKNVLMLAKEAVYGYRDGFCEYQCRVRSSREERWGREPFEGPDRWNCIECDQCDFVYIMMEIMKGTPLSEIEEYFPYQPSDTFSSGEDGFKRLFREHCSSLIYFRLSEFLRERDDNWRRLKLCPYCIKFFEAKNVAREICRSQDCEKARQREQKRPYMRKKRDSDSREYDERYKTREFPKKKPS